MYGRLVHAHTFARGQRQQEAAMALCGEALAKTPAFILTTGPDPLRLGEILPELPELSAQR